MRVAILGAGNMGGALLGGILKAGVVARDEVVATVRTEERARALRELHGCQVTAGGNPEAAKGAHVVVLAAKPNVVPRLAAEIAGVLGPGQIVLTLAAALPLHVVEHQLGAPRPVFRAMPNIPVLVEEGAIAIAPNGEARLEDRELVESLFRPVGTVCWVEEEMMDVVTALSGSGPAYVYMVIEALIAGGVKMGLPRDVAARLAEQTVLGAAKHVRQTGQHPPFSGTL